MTHDLRTPDAILKALVQELVKYPQDVTVNDVSVLRTSTLYIYCRKEDRGMIVGKGGGTLRELRKLMSIVGRKFGKTVQVEIDEEKDEELGTPIKYKFQPRPEWDHSNIEKLANAISDTAFQTKCTVQVVEAPNNLSAIDITTGRSEKPELIEMMLGTAEKLFSAIGLNQGRTIRVNIAPPMPTTL